MSSPGPRAGISVIAWAVLVLVPAWTSYSRVWERIVAIVPERSTSSRPSRLAGAGLGAAILWYYDEI